MTRYGYPHGCSNHHSVSLTIQTEFLLRMIAHLKDDSKTINWKEINMRGRSLKSLQGQWTKVNKALAELEKLGDAPMTPSKSPKKATRMIPSFSITHTSF